MSQQLSWRWSLIWLTRETIATRLVYVCYKDFKRHSRAFDEIFHLGAIFNPVLVLKFNGSRKQGYSDASTNDLPALSAYFLNYK